MPPRLLPPLVLVGTTLLALLGGPWLRPLLASPLAGTAIPELLVGLALGAAACVALGWRTAAGALGLALALTAAIVLDDPKATWSSHVKHWAPQLSLAATATWVGGWLLERRTGRPWPAITVVLVGLALTGVGLATALDAHRSVAKGTHYRAWNAYHYVLGSKYFGQLGYTDLYAATLAADDLIRAEGEVPQELRLDQVRRTRNMHTYQTEPRARAVEALDRTDLPDDTLRALHHDLRGLLPFRDAEGWKEVLSDLGYNPAPAWPVLGKPLATLLGTHDGRWVLLHLDLPLFALIIGMLAWGWGPRVAAGACLYIAIVGFNRSRLLGGFLQYDWLASLVTGMALYRRGFGASGGAALSWGAMTRVFPGFLIFPALGMVAWAWGRGKEVPRRTLRFAVAFTLACAVWFALSHTTGRGLHTWPEWVQGITLHSKLHPYDGRARMGLLRLGAHEPTADDPFGAAPRTVDVAKAEALAARVRPLQALGVLFVGLVAWRQRATDRALWMLALVWVTVITSRYYASSWALLLAMGIPGRQGDADGSQHPAGVAAAAIVLAMPWVFYLYPDHEHIYFLTNYAFGALVLGSGLIWLLGPKQDPLTPT